MIGDWLRKQRESKGLTQQEVADALGIGKSTISQYENNKREPDLKTLVGLVEFYGVNANSILPWVYRPSQPLTKNFPSETEHFWNSVEQLRNEFKNGYESQEIKINEKEHVFLTLIRRTLGNCFLTNFFSLSKEEQEQFLMDMQLIWTLQLHRRKQNNDRDSSYKR